MISLPLKFQSERILKNAGGNLAFFFDFDGTLTEIVNRPHLVRLKSVAKFLIEELAERYTVGILSGRKLSEVKQLIGIKGLYYSGNHGVEIEGPGLRFVEPQSLKSSKYILAIYKAIFQKLKGYDVLIEEKKYSVSVHYRNLKAHRVKQVFSELDAILQEPLRRQKIKVLHGKKVIEISPNVNWDKGKALEVILRKKDGVVKPVFFGDDATDEKGFKQANSLGGVSVYVGHRRRETEAQYWIGSPSALIGELAKFLFLIE